MLLLTLTNVSVTPTATLAALGIQGSSYCCYLLSLMYLLLLQLHWLL
jgi:hypothetical protein